MRRGGLADSKQTARVVGRRGGSYIISSGDARRMLSIPRVLARQNREAVGK